jgi:hypothetical protein
MYKVKSIDKEHNIYQLTKGNFYTLQDVSKFLYPEKKDKCGIIKKDNRFSKITFDELYEKDNNFEIKIINQYNHLIKKNNTVIHQVEFEVEELIEPDNNVKYRYCDYCLERYSLFLYDEIVEYHVCANCIKKKKLLEEAALIFKQISKNQPNIIYLSDRRRNMEIDYYVKFCYFDNTKILSLIRYIMQIIY